MTIRANILSVIERQHQGQLSLAGERLCYQFSEDSSPTGLCAWPVADHYCVAESCRAINGVYRQQALNAVLAQKIMQHRPTAMVLWGVNGASVDLIRVAALLNVPCHVVLAKPLEEPLSAKAEVWLTDCLAKASSVALAGGEQKAAIAKSWQPYINHIEDSLNLDGLVSHGDGSAAIAAQFDYSLYELCARDHSLIIRMQEHDVEHFKACQSVLDVGCGAGLFLQLLGEQSINALGVERNEIIAEYARGTGLNVSTADSLAYLRESKNQHDCIYCSHFVEHLPIEVLQDMIALMADCLSPDGVLVLAFPDPESIRSQLLGFWRDPEHVRFYHPNLIRVMAESAGLLCEWSSYDQQPHEVYPFSLEPEPIDYQPVEPPASTTPTLWQALLAKLGIASRADIAQMRQQLLAQQSYITQLEARTQTLWNVNKTWAWNDNVTLRFRKV